MGDGYYHTVHINIHRVMPTNMQSSHTYMQLAQVIRSASVFDTEYEKKEVSRTGCVHENMIWTSSKSSSNRIPSHWYYIHRLWYVIVSSQTCFDMFELIWRHDQYKQRIYDSHGRICGLECNRQYWYVLTGLNTEKCMFQHAQQDEKQI